MNLPKPEDATPMLDEIFELAGLLRIHVGHIEQYAMIGDLVGLGYASRRSWGYMKAIRDLVKLSRSKESPPEPEADRLEPVEPGDDVVPWVEENEA